MLLHLIKKDFLLIKKYLPLLVILPFAIPIFVMIQVSQLLGLGAFVLSVIFTVFMLYQYVLMVEMKYPKAEALLCATPYSRSTLVKARYAFLLLMFAYSCVAYYVLALLFSKIEYLTPASYLIAMLISVILFGVYTPIQYKLGFEKTKYFFTLVINGNAIFNNYISKSQYQTRFYCIVCTAYVFPVPYTDCGYNWYSLYFYKCIYKNLLKERIDVTVV